MIVNKLVKESDAMKGLLPKSLAFNEFKSCHTNHLKLITKSWLITLTCINSQIEWVFEVHAERSLQNLSKKINTMWIDMISYYP